MKETRYLLEQRDLVNRDRRVSIESNSEKTIDHDKITNNGNFTRLHPTEPVNSMEKLTKIEEKDSGLLIED